MSTLVVSSQNVAKAINTVIAQHQKLFIQEYNFNSLKNDLIECYQMNIKSYNERYKCDLVFTLQHLESYSTTTLIQTLKTLQCLRYNIDSEGNNTSYQALINIINLLQETIIHDMEEWKDAKWG